jgi:hypothetical protein
MSPAKAEREELEAGRRRAEELERVAAERQEIEKRDVEGREAGTRAQEEAAGCACETAYRRS